MSVKLVISGLAGSGKTSLTKDLENALVISHDGKRYPFKVPHVVIPTFDSASELTALITEKIEAFNERFGKYPETIVFDSVSKIFDTIMDNCNTRFTGFNIYTALNKEVHEVTSYVEDSLVASGINVVLISHAIHDSETSTYSLVGKGDFQKRGGFFAEVDFAMFIEMKSNKRVLHLRSTKFPARTLNDSDPDSLPIDEFSLQDYITELSSTREEVDEFIL